MEPTKINQTINQSTVPVFRYGAWVPLRTLIINKPIFSERVPEIHELLEDL